MSLRSNLPRRRTVARRAVFGGAAVGLTVVLAACVGARETDLFSASGTGSDGADAAARADGASPPDFGPPPPSSPPTPPPPPPLVPDGAPQPADGAGGAVDAAPPRTVPCGDDDGGARVCTAPAVCCGDYPTGAPPPALACSSLSACTGPGKFSLACRTSAECTGANVCCGTVPQSGPQKNLWQGVACAATCGGPDRFLMCDPAAPSCPSGETCSPSTQLPGYGRCT